MTGHAQSTASAARDSLGCTMSHLADDQYLAVPGVQIYRKTSHATGASRVETPASERGLLLGTALGTGHRRMIFRARRAQSCEFGQNTIYLRSFADDYRADIETPFDFLLMELAPGGFHDEPAECERRVREGLADLQGVRDPVLAHLTHALLPALARPSEAGALFVDQVSQAIRTHILMSYGGEARPVEARRPRLSPVQERRAKELIAQSLTGDILIADIATACGLSRSHFIRAFGQTTGVTPYRWLLEQRIARAKLLLATPQPLAEIATSCGFADQSHFTRVFSRLAGMPPAAWRRAR